MTDFVNTAPSDNIPPKQTPSGEKENAASKAAAQAPVIKANPSKPKRTYSPKEKTLAYLSIILGYLFCRSFVIWENPSVALLFSLCLFIFAFLFTGKIKRSPESLFYPVSALILSSSLFFSASPTLVSVVFLYTCFAFFMFCQKSSGAALEKRAGQLYFFETVKALFVSPFKCLGSAAVAVTSDKGGKRLCKTLLIILAGVGIAAVPTLIVLRLLSFDGNFMHILDMIRLAVIDKFLIRLRSLLLGIPIGMYIFDTLYSSAHVKPDRFTAEKCEETQSKMKVAPPSVGAVAAAPLLFLYGVFITAQYDYYKAVFTRSLPDAYTFSEFARNGFFRLCAVAAVNALALIALRVFSKKTKAGKVSPVVKVYTVLLSLLTIVISATAISQMIMYVSAYGLTRLRLYSLWFMALLILLFLLAILKQFIEKLPFTATALVIFVVCFSLLAIPDSDANISRHNYNCQLESTRYKLDVDYLEELAPSSIPVLCEAARNAGLSNEIRKSAQEALSRYASIERRVNSLPSLSAERALKEYFAAKPLPEE